ncbi:MAG: hypothetical protein IKZ34_01120 [Alphaproteobacteria bacterium]|nr:hypothetical protein [Alphaproteobacteria bacterium]
MLLRIPLVEYQGCKYTDLPIPEGVSNPLLDSGFVDGLEHFLQKNKLDKVLSFGRKGIKASSYVGVIKYKNIQFEILPKLSSKNEDDNQILKNLFYMLSFTKKLNVKNNKSASLSACSNPFLEILIGAFAEGLFDALKRCAPKGYIVRSENVKYLKGRLNLPSHIKYNSFNQSRFFCDYDEFSENNVLNQLFLYVATCLYSVCRTQQNKKLLKLIINFYSDVDFVCFDNKDLSVIKLSRAQSGFEMPLKLAKMFVEKTSVDMSAHKFENIALIWDMNFLFEEFVAEFLKRYKQDLDIKYISCQHSRKLLISEENDRGYASTYVDVFLVMNNGKKLVLDTKYKNNQGQFGEFSNADVFQVTTYCRLHDCHNAILLYPAADKNKNDEHSYRLNVDTGIEELHVKTSRIYIMDDLQKETEQLKARFRQILTVAN